MTKPQNPLKCSVDGCDRPRRGGVLCEMHYYRYRRYGDFEKRGHRKKYDDGKTMDEHLIDKFLRGVHESEGCWSCDTAISNPETGYCEVVIDRGKNGKFREYAHRLSFTHFKGPIPDGLHVLHSCDNPPCCNPGHLFAGTREDNMDDMVDKGRHYRGQNNRKPFLTESDVLSMYDLYDEGKISQYEIGRRFGINERAVWLIVHGKRWRHLYRKHRTSDSVKR